MKKVILSLACLLLMAVTGSFAQGNLQFNQAIKLDIVGAPIVGSGSNYVQIANQMVTIPAGKVWKIESKFVNITKGQYTTTTFSWLYSAGGFTPVLYMDNTIIWAGTTNPNNFTDHQLIWLPAGTYDFSLWCQRTSNAVPFTFTAVVNAIEFNVVP